MFTSLNESGKCIPKAVTITRNNKIRLKGDMKKINVSALRQDSVSSSVNDEVI